MSIQRYDLSMKTKTLLDHTRKTKNVMARIDEDTYMGLKKFNVHISGVIRIALKKALERARAGKLVLVLAPLLISCGTPDRPHEDPPYCAGTKTIQSDWSGIYEGQTMTFAMSNVAFNTPTTFRMTFADGNYCQVNAFFRGNVCSGFWNITDGVYGGVDPDDGRCIYVGGNYYFNTKGENYEILTVCEVGCSDLN